MYHNYDIDLRIILERILAPRTIYVDEQRLECALVWRWFRNLLRCIYRYEERENTMGLPRRLLAVNTDDGETARRWDRVGRIDRDLILFNDAHPGNMILSTGEVRARRQAPTTPSIPPHSLCIAVQLDLRVTSLLENSPKTRDECR